MNRWETKFGSFVHSYGVSTLAAALDVHPSAVHHWIGGRTYPRVPHACAMEHLAAERGFSLSLDDIYEGPRQVIAEACSMPTTEFRNKSTAKQIAGILRKNPQCR